MDYSKFVELISRFRRSASRTERLAISQSIAAASPVPSVGVALVWEAEINEYPDNPLSPRLLKAVQTYIGERTRTFRYADEHGIDGGERERPYRLQEVKAMREEGITMLGARR